MNIHTVFHIPTLHGKIFEEIFPMWKFAKLLPVKQTKSNLTFTIYCPNFGGNYTVIIFRVIGNIISIPNIIKQIFDIYSFNDILTTLLIQFLVNILLF